MPLYRADLHIHTTLSPCGSLEMSPVRILKEAAARQLNLIAITDHNTTRQCSVVKRMGSTFGIQVLYGAEINTREEIHCLCLFETQEQANLFQQWIDLHLPNIANHPNLFGDQVWVDEEELILGEEPRLLLTGLNQNIQETEQMVHRIGGIILAAHVDRPSYSIVSQLGFLPDDLHLDGIEISRMTPNEAFSQKHPSFDHLTRITASDAHHLHQIGQAITQFYGDGSPWNALCQALANQQTTLQYP